MNAAELIDVIDKIYFITDEDRKKYPILKDLTMVYRPYGSVFAKITLNDAIEYAKSCRVFEYDDWRLPHLSGKRCGEIDLEEMKKYRCINKYFQPCMKREFIEKVSEMAAIVDIFRSRSKDDNYFLCLNECWFYYTDNTCNNTFMLMAGDGLPSWSNKDDEGNDFILVR